MNPNQITITIKNIGLFTSVFSPLGIGFDDIEQGWWIDPKNKDRAEKICKHPNNKSSLP